MTSGTWQTTGKFENIRDFHAWQWRQRQAKKQRYHLTDQELDRLLKEQESIDWLGQELDYWGNCAIYAGGNPIPPVKLEQTRFKPGCPYAVWRCGAPLPIPEPCVDF